MKTKMRIIQHGTRRTVSIARHWPITSGIVALATVGFGIAGVGEAFPANLPAVAKPVVARSADPQGLFDARSPGSRRYGWLNPTKQPRTGFDVGPPSERILTSVRRRPGTPAVPAGVGGDPSPAVYTPIDGDFDASQQAPTGVAVFDDVVPTGPGGVFAPGNPIGGVLPGSGGSGAGGLPDGGNPTSPPAVPEPATWAMLALGFLGIGTAMRRRKFGRQLCGAC